MRKAAYSFILLALAALASPAGAHPRPPVIVELFTAQGCSSCSDANALVGELAEREGVLPLTFSVDYWDYLGWPDTFALPEFTERQKAYARRLGPREVYTPQVVVDGAKQASGAKPATSCASSCGWAAGAAGPTTIACPPPNRRGWKRW